MIAMPKEYHSYDRILSMALAALKSNANIRFQSNGCLDMWGVSNYTYTLVSTSSTDYFEIE
jgi:hypothetical protein